MELLTDIIYQFQLDLKNLAVVDDQPETGLNDGISRQLDQVNVLDAAAIGLGDEGHSPFGILPKAAIVFGVWVPDQHVIEVMANPIVVVEVGLAGGQLEHVLVPEPDLGEHAEVEVLVLFG